MSTENNIAIAMQALEEKLLDAEIPGGYAAFTADEAAFLGAFDEDAISESDALAASFHNPELVAEVEAELAK